MTDTGLGALVLRVFLRIRPLVGALSHHTADPSTILKPSEGMADLLGQLVRAGGASLGLRVVGRGVLVGERSLRFSPEAGRGVVAVGVWLGQWGIAGLVVDAPPTSDDVQRAFRVFTHPERRTIDQCNAVLLESGVRSLRFVGPLEAFVAEGGVSDPALGCMGVYLSGVRVMRSVQARGMSAGLWGDIGGVADNMVQLDEHAPERFFALITPEQPVRYEVRHPVHMAICSIALGRPMGLTTAQLRDAATVAMLVDLGMSQVPEPIRQEVGRLTPAEQRALRQHSADTVASLLRHGLFDPHWRRAIRVAFEHHLGVDGRGYPATLRWPELHAITRLLGVADAYDALRSSRPWRQGRPAPQVLEVMREQVGRRYDPDVFAHLELLVNQQHARTEAEADTEKLRQGVGPMSGGPA